LGLGIDEAGIAALTRFLDDRALGSGPVTVERIGDGHSNLNYRVRRDGADVVLRRPPRGQLAPSAHDVLREARLLQALAGRIPVSRVLATCEDTAVLGAPFYLMEHLPGVVLTDRLPPGVDLERWPGELMELLVDTLVDIHAVEWKEAGLADFARPGDYAARQHRRFAMLWEHNRTREIADVDRVAGWLAENMPPQTEATIVHGDYRIGNVMVVPQHPPHLSAVLDWELATLGDPIADLGYLLATYPEPGEKSLFSRRSPLPLLPGFPSRAELASRYAERSGRSIETLRWYQALALWKSSIWLEGSYRRYTEGKSDDEFFAELELGVPELAGQARAIAEGADSGVGR
jgi:aminoglycoside phosphotransferase (APT) family kinase protein